MMIEHELRAWCQARTEAPDEGIYACDARHALALGLPVLAAIALLLERLQTANECLSRQEVEAELRPILSLAVGEACERIHARGLLRIDPPGLPTIPQRVLETRRECTLKAEMERVFGSSCTVIYDHGQYQTVAVEGWPDAITYDCVLALRVLGSYRRGAGVTKSGEAAVCSELEQYGAKVVGLEEDRLLKAAEARLLAESN